MTTSTPPPSQSVAHTLLRTAHSPTSATTIFTEKVLQKPLFLRPSSPDPKSSSARAARRLARLRKKQHFLRHQKPRPLSAKQKRKLCVHELPKGETRKWAVYEGLRDLWIGYMWDILGLKTQEETPAKAAYITAQNAGSLLCSADFHGAEVEVVRSRCVGRVGTRGIVVRDTKFTFEIVTRRDEVKTIPKEQTIFRVEVPQPGSVTKDDGSVERLPNLVFEVYGERFRSRAPERATKKFKWRRMDDL